MKKKFSLLLIVFTVCVAYAKELTFPIFAGSFEYMPIKQVDDLFCSSVDIGAYFFNESVFSVNKAEDEKSEKSRNIQNSCASLLYFILDSLIFNSITHEEAHRAVLTSKNIGSLSQPILKFDSPLAGIAYVKGVSDASLMNLRDTDFPTFIRLHTAGLESDYCIMQRSFSDLVFENNDISKIELNKVPVNFLTYLTRVISSVAYLSANEFSKGIDVPEETDELERDIVGDDVCGMIHHLFNPQAEYHRYFSKKDFSSEEKTFLKRVAYRSFINLPVVSSATFRMFMPMDFGKVHLNFNTGYNLAPFGDFFDENVFLKIDDVMCNSLNLMFTARQYENKENWFPEFIIKCDQFSPLSWLTLSAETNLWWQPEKLDFITEKAFVGGAVSLGVNVYPFKKNPNAKYDFGINMNILYKTKGFMQEIMSLDEAWCFTAGISVRY